MRFFFVFPILFTIILCQKCGEFESECRSVGKNSLQQHVILFGDAKGVFSEIYLVDTTYYGESCEQSMFSISNKILLSSQTFQNENKTTIVGTIRDIEITLYNLTLMEYDGIVCNINNETIYPISLSEISCYYSTIPIFASYSSMLSQSKEYSLQFLPLSIDINGLSFQYLRNTGCSPSIVTESPTELPPDNDEVNIMNIVAAFLLFLIILFLVIKCILSIQEDKRSLKQITKSKQASSIDIEMSNRNSSE